MRIKSVRAAIFLTVSLIVLPLTLAGSKKGAGTIRLDAGYPRIASWLAKKDEIIQSGKPYALVMAGWFTPAEAERIRASNPRVKLLVGLSVNFIWADHEWLTFLETVSSFGREQPLRVTEEMYLRTPDGRKCPFGWASDQWGHEEIYAMDPRNADWAELIISFYRVVLAREQHDGIIVDMVTESPTHWWPDAIADSDWVMATKSILARIKEENADDKPIIFNAGANLADIDAYGEFFTGYVLENFLGAWGADFEAGIRAVDGPYLVVYAVDTDNTGRQDPECLRLGLTLSLLGDNTFFAYDFGSRDHGQAWWFAEYDADLGRPLGGYYARNDSYRRDFEGGTVVSSPRADTTVVFDCPHLDVTSGRTGTRFTVPAGDGRIYLNQVK